MSNQFTDFQCKNLNLKFGNKILLTDFHFNFKGPGIVMIEGENGTGKSSLLKLFAGFIITNGGHIRFSDNSPLDIKEQDFSFFAATSMGLLNNLSGREHIELVSKSLRLESELVSRKILEYQEIELFNEILDKPVADYSQGMKQFLRLFLHLFFGPKVVFLDEPFLYLSPKLKSFLQRKIEFMASNSLVFLTDQSFSWKPNAENKKIILGAK